MPKRTYQRRIPRNAELVGREIVLRQLPLGLKDCKWLGKRGRVLYYDGKYAPLTFHLSIDGHTIYAERKHFDVI